MPVFEVFCTRRDRQRSPVRHGVARVHGQVQERHLQLVGVGHCGGEVRLDVQLDRHPRPHRARQQVLHAPDQSGHVNGLRLKGLPPREGEQALNQGLGALGGLERPIDHPLGPSIGDPSALEHVQAADDWHQEVVEVVGDAAGQLTHGVHLLALPQRVLHIEQFARPRLVRAQVPPDGDEIHPVRLRDNGPSDRLPLIVRCPDPVLEPRGLLRPTHGFQRGEGHFHVVGMHEVRVGSGQQLPLGEAEHLRPGRVDGAHHARVVGPREHVFGEKPEPVALVRSLLLLGDVAADAVDEAIVRDGDPRDPAVAAILAAIAVGEPERRLTGLRQIEDLAGAFNVVRM